MRKPKNYYNDKLIIKELKKIKKRIGHFPTRNELKRGIESQIYKHGGMNKFRNLLGCERWKPKSCWSDDIIIKELKLIITNYNHFPTQNELKLINRQDILSAISKNGGFNKFRELMGYKLLKNSNGFWTDNIIIENIMEIIEKIGHFPTQRELSNMNTCLLGAICHNGGINKFRKLIGYNYLHKPKGYWSDDNIIKELKEIENEIGHFPTNDELTLLKRGGLRSAIQKHGGLNKFCILFGYEPLIKPDGYWTDETIIQELKEIKDKIGHFPSFNELLLMNRTDVANAIQHNGGFPKFHNLLGYTSIQEKYKSELSLYGIKRGKFTENIVKQILIDYSSLHPLPSLQLNVKLSTSHVIEFVCNTGKVIGIDVTNTESKRVVSYKWTKKQYHLHLDELWIVVFGTFTEQDYNKWNETSPENVKIFSVYGFLEELDYSLDSHTKQKIDKYNSCTFHTKDELMNKNT